MLTAGEVLELIPQQRPFRFIDRLVAIDDQGALGEYLFRPDEGFYEGHFPGNPVTPGAVLLETMCQTGLVALGIYLLGLEAPRNDVANFVTYLIDSQVEFKRIVRPGEMVRIAAKRVFWRCHKLKAQVALTLANGTRVASGTVSGIGVSREPR